MDAAKENRWGRDTVSNAESAGTRSAVETLATRLRAARKRRGWTQQELAARACTSQSVIQKIENNKSLRPRIIGSIANALEVEPCWLLFGAGATAPLSSEAIAVARAWSELPEPERSSVREAVGTLLKCVKRTGKALKGGSGRLTI